MAASYHKKSLSRATLPRRTTRGPLDDNDDDDPLSATLSPASPSSTRASFIVTPPIRAQDPNPIDQHVDAQRSLLDEDENDKDDNANDKNLSFLLDAAIYHPLSQVDVPIPFRKPFAGPPPPGTTISQALAQVDSLIAKCDFIGAAHLAAICLTSGVVQANDYNSIFKLLATRYSCLELVGQLLLAAQEAKALEDLSSEYYYVTPQASEAEIEANDGQKPLASHIMPFSLRVQAIRLQNIGFSDPRRGITALYDLGLEVRDHLASPYTSDVDHKLWVQRLESLSIHVVNALIELGDINCAQRTLLQSKPSAPEARTRWTSRMVLILVKLGQLKRAHSYIDELEANEQEKSLLLSLLAIAEGRIEEGAKLLEDVLHQNRGSETATLARQNLAVAYLYLGRISEARTLLDALVEDGHSFVSLTINLATIYDLTSDRSRDQKVELINKLASQQSQRHFTNADFKL